MATETQNGKETQQIVLTGTDKEKSNQIIKLVEEGKLTKEILGSNIPSSVEFFKTLGDTIKAQIDADRFSDQYFTNRMKEITELCHSAINNNNVDHEEKLAIIELLGKIAEYQAALKRRVGDDSATIKKISIFGGLTLAGFIAWLFMGRNGNSFRS